MRIVNTYSKLHISNFVFQVGSSEESFDHGYLALAMVYQT